MEAVTTRLSRLRAYELSPAAFRWLAGLTLAALWLIVSTGAVVRLTRSGLGCEQRPLSLREPI
jgi:heme A synthase